MMRLPRPRLTIRRLMVLVAVFALILGLSALVSRWNYCRRRAEKYERLAKFHRGELEAIDLTGKRPWYYDDIRAALPAAEQQARRFRAAQRRPWLRVPDGSD